jgi:hypothetical protein
MGNGFNNKPNGLWGKLYHRGSHLTAMQWGCTVASRATYAVNGMSTRGSHV